MICQMRRGNYHHKCSTMRFFHLLPRKESFLSISISYKYLGNEYYPVTFYCTINSTFLGSMFITLDGFFFYFIAPQKKKWILDVIKWSLVWNSYILFGWLAWPFLSLLEEAVTASSFMTIMTTWNEQSILT